MTSFFFYLSKVSIYVGMFYSLYVLIFRRFTFHRINRFYLVGGLVFSFILPFLKLPANEIVNPLPINLLLDGFEELGSDVLLEKKVESTGVTFHWQVLLFIIYVVVSSGKAFVFIRNVVSIIRIKNSTSRRTYLKINYNSGEKISQPFSFLKWIFIPEKTRTGFEEKGILTHEKAHADQLHTLDLFFVEITLIILWFNPFVYLFRRSLKQVHEYLADAVSLKHEEEKAEYLRLILRSARQVAFSGIASQFYWLTIKKRIHMITKNKTKKLYAFGYLLLIPVVALMLMAFSVGVVRSETTSKSLSNPPSLKPVSGDNIKKTSGYGMRIHPIIKEEKFHSGVDFAAPIGTPVLAAADGRVIIKEFKQENQGYGRMLVIQHDNTYSSLYSQLSAFKVEAGDEVKRGQVIGLVGSSGISTGPHLHYEVWKNEEKVNPEDYFH